MLLSGIFDVIDFEHYGPFPVQIFVGRDCLSRANIGKVDRNGDSGDNSVQILMYGVKCSSGSNLKLGSFANLLSMKEFMLWVFV